MIWAVHLRKKQRPVVLVEPSLNHKVFEIMEWIDWAVFLATMTYVIGKIVESQLNLLTRYEIIKCLFWYHNFIILSKSGILHFSCVRRRLYVLTRISMETSFNSQSFNTQPIQNNHSTYCQYPLQGKKSLIFEFLLTCDSSLKSYAIWVNDEYIIKYSFL